MKTFVVGFSDRNIQCVCGRINEYAAKRGFEIVSTNAVYSTTGYHVVVVFRKEGENGSNI